MQIFTKRHINFQAKVLFKAFGAALIVLSAFSSSVYPNTVDGLEKEKNNERPRIGLVLSGGGARGAAHVGVLKVLEENHIPVDVISGTSFGAIVGGLYAAGYTAEELRQILEAIDWEATLSSDAPRQKQSFRRKQDDDGFLIKFKIGIENGELKLPTGLITPNNLRLLLRDLVKNVSQINNFDDLPIPFRAVATDLETGEEVIFRSGNLGTAMIASMAVPALFPPVEFNGKLMVDGGVVNNVPINVARDMGADIVIVVDISTPLKTKDEIESFASVIDQLTMLMTNKSASLQLATLGAEDILISPELGDLSLVDFERSSEAIPKGAEATKKILPQLLPLSLDNDLWQDHLETRRLPQDKGGPIEFIRIVNDSHVNDEVIKSRLSQKIGESLDPKKFSEDITKVYGLGLFEEVNYKIVDEQGLKGVEVEAKKQKQDGNIRFGLALQESFEGESNYQLAAGITKLAINDRGGEWKALGKIGNETGLFTEFYQPIDYGDNYYFYAGALGQKYNRNFMDSDGDILAQFRLSEAFFQGGFGVNFGQSISLRAGLARSYGKIKGRIGVPKGTSVNTDSTTFISHFILDSLDNPRFPHSGSNFEAVYTNNLKWFKGDSQVDSLFIGGFHPHTWGGNTLGLNYRFATTFNGTPDETDLFPLGGFKLNGI